MLSTYTVSNTNVSGSGSLQQAVASANGDGTGTPIQINFALSSYPATISLSTGLEITTESPVTINGPGSTSLNLYGGSGTYTSLLSIATGATATIIGVNIGLTEASDGLIFNQGTLTVENSTVVGNTIGSGIVSQGALTVSNCQITLNHSTAADPMGGGIDQQAGALTITDSVIQLNSAFYSPSSGPVEGQGGGIFAGGPSLNITGSTIDSNSAGSAGGAIWNDCELLTIQNTTINGNSADSLGDGTTYGGGIFNSDGDPINISDSTLSENSADNGGAIFNNSSLVSLSAATVEDNTAADQGGGIDVNGDELNLAAGCLVTGNTAGSSGGGIYVDYDGQANITDSTISDNSSGTGGGGGICNNGTLSITTSAVTDNQDTGFGGGIANNGGTLDISQSTVSLNSVFSSYTSGELTYAEGEGGGIFSVGTSLVITDSTINTNSAGNAGGGLYNDSESASIEASTLMNNEANTQGEGGSTFGGGIYNEDGDPLSITASTLCDNTAEEGGGIFNLYSNLTIVSSTLASNFADDQGGAIIDFNALTMTDSTVVDNDAGNEYGGILDDSGGELSGDIVAQNSVGDLNGGTFTGTYNLIGDGSGGLTDPSNVPMPTSDPIDPMLAVLGYYGGPTQTMPPLPGSPALGAGAIFDSPGTETSITADQRGYPMDSLSSHPDIGAFQSQADPLLVNTSQYDPVGLEHLSVFDAMNLASALGITGGIQFRVPLPDMPAGSYSVPSPEPTLPTGSSIFSPPVTTQTPPSTAPVVAATNLTASPGGTITVTGSNFTDDTGDNYADTRLIVYGQTTLADATLGDAGLQDPTANGVLATIPSAEPTGSMYLVWPVNSSGVGLPVAINQTTAQWFQPTTAAPGQTVSVYGRNLDNGSGASWIYLQSASGSGQWATVTSANPYQVQFTVPVGFATANYKIWVYNGEGGNYGWSEATSTATPLVVEPAPSRGTVINVTSSSLGTDEVFPEIAGDAPVDNAAAINYLLYTYAGDTLYFPAGTYLVNNNATQYLYILGSGLSGTYGLSFHGNSYTLDSGDTASQIQSTIDPDGTYGLDVTSASVTDGTEFTFTCSTTNFTPILLNTSNLVNTDNAKSYITGVGQLELNSNDHIEGAGPDLSTILFNGNVPFGPLASGTFYDIGETNGVDNVSFDSIGLNNLCPTSAEGGGAMVDIEFGDYIGSPALPDQPIEFQNDSLISNNIQAVRLQNCRFVRLNTLFVVSPEVFLNNCDDVSLSGDTFLQDYAQPVAYITIIRGQNVSMTDCVTENYYDYLVAAGETPSSTADLYGEGKFVDFNATISNIYLADNQSINLGEYAPPVDENSGEQVLLDDDPHDPMELQVVPNVTAASSGGATVTVAGNYSGLPGQTPGWQVLVENGAGEGERLEIASAIYEDGDTQFTLAGTFAVTPAAGTYLNINQDPFNVVFYDNSLSHSTGVSGTYDHASTGFDIHDGYDVVLDDNTITDCTFGMRLMAEGQGPFGDTSYDGWSTLAFVDVINNSITIPEEAFYQPVGIYLLTLQNGITIARPDPGYIGVTLFNNTITMSAVEYEPAGTTLAAAGIGMPGYSGSETYSPAAGTFVVVEDNNLYSLPFGLGVADDLDAFVTGNTFEADSYGCVAIEYLTGSSEVLLQGNIFGGDEQPFDVASGATPAALLELPTDADIFLASSGTTSVSTTILIENVGVIGTSFTATFGSGSTGLTVQRTTMKIGAESVTTDVVIANPAGLAAGNYWSTLTLTFDGGLTREIDIDFTVLS